MNHLTIINYCDVISIINNPVSLILSRQPTNLTYWFWSANCRWPPASRPLACGRPALQPDLARPRSGTGKECSVRQNGGQVGEVVEEGPAERGRHVHPEGRDRHAGERARMGRHASVHLEDERHLVLGVQVVVQGTIACILLLLHLSLTSCFPNPSCPLFARSQYHANAMPSLVKHVRHKHPDATPAKPGANVRSYAAAAEAAAKKSLDAPSRRKEPERSLEKISPDTPTVVPAAQPAGKPGGIVKPAVTNNQSAEPKPKPAVQRKGPSPAKGASPTKQSVGSSAGVSKNASAPPKHSGQLKKSPPGKEVGAANMPKKSVVASSRKSTGVDGSAGPNSAPPAAAKVVPTKPTAAPTKPVMADSGGPGATSALPPMGSPSVYSTGSGMPALGIASPGITKRRFSKPKGVAPSAVVKEVAETCQKLLFMATGMTFANVKFQVPATPEEARGVIRGPVPDMERSNCTKKLYLLGWAFSQMLSAEMAALGYRLTTSTLKQINKMQEPPPVEKWLTLVRHGRVSRKKGVPVSPALPKTALPTPGKVRVKVEGSSKDAVGDDARAGAAATKLPMVTKTSPGKPAAYPRRSAPGTARKTAVGINSPRMREAKAKAVQSPSPRKASSASSKRTKSKTKVIDTIDLT